MKTINLKQLFTQYKILALLIAIAIIWAFFSWKTEGGFISPRNLSNLMRQMAVTGIVACGMAFVIIAGEIDLSVGSLLGLLGGVAAVLDVTHTCRCRPPSRWCWPAAWCLACSTAT